MWRIWRMYRELTRYGHTTYIRYCPPHFVEWQCPKHQDSKTIHIDEYVEDMSSNLRKIEI